ncbi:PucR family transcriptional regulator [Nocardia cyriacigeorgica]|uniref:PucR family transcriptional regulator n=1 Tax=Nocardia cyriacigeorgica TaxID=135487 RepID=A0A5R8NPI3_9NOCA|nr:helix-turn-helix domain-containing protein [Nocardia cyriacigeorgica]TLF77444.1 PucR family transcriptional regulator [Nocardia cyriacigeorgica]
MEQSWPRPSGQVAEIWRRAARTAFDSADSWFGDRRETLRGAPLRPIAEDPALAEAVQRGNVAVLRQWAFANMHEPGRRVTADAPPELLASARDMVRRGLDKSILNAYRTGQSLAWRRWMQTCFAEATDTADLPELFDLSAQSVSTFIDDIVEAVGVAMDAERRALTRGTHAERLTAATLLIEGAAIPRSRAEAQLGYRLTGPHTAAIVWDTSATAAGELDAAAEILTRHSGAAGRLTVIAGANALWLWLPTATVLDTAALAADISAYDSIRLAIGRPGRGVDGFRRSHLDAATTQQLLARLTAPQQVARYDDIAVVALLTRDPARADEFVRDTLGELLTADAETLTVVRGYIQQLCNTSRTAQRLFIHRNTIIRRLARADELLPKPLGDNIVAVAAALEVLHWRGEPGTRRSHSPGR